MSIVPKLRPYLIHPIYLDFVFKCETYRFEENSLMIGLKLLSLASRNFGPLIMILHHLKEEI